MSCMVKPESVGGYGVPTLSPVLGLGCCRPRRREESPGGLKYLLQPSPEKGHLSDPHGATCHCTGMKPSRTEHGSHSIAVAGDLKSCCGSLSRRRDPCPPSYSRCRVPSCPMGDSVLLAMGRS